MTETTKASTSSTVKDKKPTLKHDGFSMHRVKTIIKSTADNLPVTSESLLVVTRATELFIQHLAKRAYEASDDGFLEYDHLAKLVKSEEKYEFLQQIIPKKLTARECRELIRKSIAEDNLSISEEDEEN